MNLKDLLPKRPAMDDGELNEWLFEHGGRGREVLTYRKVKIRNPLTEILEPFAECTCSVCDAKWHTQVYGYNGSYPEFENHDGIQVNGKMTTCPECGAIVEAAYYTRLRRHPIKSTLYPWEIVKKEGCIMFICWAVIHEIDDEGSYIYPEARNAYVLDCTGKWHRFTAMERSGWSSMSKMEYTGNWNEMSKFSVADGNFRNILPHEENLYMGTRLENAKLELLEKCHGGGDLLMYARIYARHPTIENITMNSPLIMTALLLETYNVKGMDWLNWRTAKPHEMLYMEKPEFTATKEMNLYDAARLCKRQRAVAACVKWGVSKTYADTLGEAGTVFANNPKNRHMMPWGLVRTWNYILKINEKYKKESRRDTLSDTITLCEDYWQDMRRAGLDVTSSMVVFPKDIKEAHARAIVAIKYSEHEHLKAKFVTQGKKLQPLRWEHFGLMIFPAMSESELIAEGKVLEHCVGGYGEDHCIGNSIFFIRKAEAPDIPFFTLQLNTKTGAVLQNHGKKNCSRTPQVIEFEKLWLKEIVVPWIENNTKASKKRKNADVKENVA